MTMNPEKARAFRFRTAFTQGAIDQMVEAMRLIPGVNITKVEDMGCAVVVSDELGMLAYLPKEQTPGEGK